MRLRLLAAVLGSITLLVGACSSGAAPAPAGGSGTVGAELSEWAIKLDSSTGKAGTVTFSVNNKGEKEHEFVIVKTDLKADSLPVVDDGVDESAFTPVDEIEDIAAGATPSLAVDLQPGHYVILCNLTSHYQKGMYADFDVQ